MTYRMTRWERDLQKGAKRKGMKLVFKHCSKHLRVHVSKDGKCGTTSIAKTPGGGNALQIALGKLSRTLI